MGVLGAVPLDCPVCDEHLTVPVSSVEWPLSGGRVRFTFDQGYVDAHCQTHAANHRTQLERSIQ